MLASGMMSTDTSSFLKEGLITNPQAVTTTTAQAAAGVGSVATSSEQISTSTQTDKQTINPNKDVENQVREYFADIPIMIAISKCESQYRQYEKDGSIFRGIVNNKDVGVMQINEYYHLDRAQKLGIDLYTVQGNMQYARLLYSEYGTDPWSSSEPCWSKSAIAKAISSQSNASLLAQNN